MTAIQFSYDPSSLPNNFTAEERWGDLVSAVLDQARGTISTPFYIRNAAYRDANLNSYSNHKISKMAFAKKI
jgi:hypothetical protein